MYFYELSKENLDLSKFELLSMTNQAYSLVENYLFLDEPINCKYLAYTKKKYYLLFSCEPNELKEKMSEFDFSSVYRESFKLELIHNKEFDVKELSKIIWSKIDNPKASMKNPKIIFSIVFLDKAYFAIEEWKQTDRFEERKAHLRPFNHPTSLHPRLARAMINLAKSNEILDPFCGSGGLLIEGGLANKKMTGFDIDEIMIKRCKENLSFYNLNNSVKIMQKNALSLNTNFESIVTDVPYGKNSIAKDLDETLKRFMKLSFTHSKRAVIALPDFIDKKIIISAGWKVIATFENYLHKTLTKKIFVLEK